MKKCNIHYIWGDYICFHDKANLEILPYGLHFSEVMSFT